MPPTTAQRRAHYDDFVTRVITRCKVNGIRADLVTGRGRPVNECDRLDQHLIPLAAGFGAARAHYTVAGLIAMQRELPHEDGPYLPEDPAPDPADDNAPGQDTPATSLTNATPDLLRPADETSQDTPPRLWRSRPDFGTTLALAVARHGFDKARTTQQVKILTKLGTDLLHPHVWRLTSRLHTRHAARLDFAVLLEDLARWDYTPRDIAARWRNSYFTTLHTLIPDEEETA
ncbi:type I-E CRISPR-associated protein Cse2/CasB [Streptomyces europaeiscabiei]|uniref:type I-E CRISPR-associated protein Cse2/CasB n=2 Tax=Streptomyces europaeiscabiei TaxID=146819 RepID=UPI003EC0BEFC